MRKVLLAFTLLAFYACSSEPQTESSEPEAVVEMPTLNVYGDSISPEGALLPQEMMARLAGNDSIEAKVEAKINQTCRMKGCWMTLDAGDGSEMRVRFKDYGFFVPKEGADGKTAIVEGFAFVDTISVEHLRHLAEDAGKSEEEIAAINEPEISVNFEAHGVIIKD
ncbi:MAG: DUF4920 domain-containing protein [Cryomorphaceae bacterium]